MTEKELELHDKIAHMEGDLRSTVITILGVLKSFNINIEELSADGENIMSKLPGILSNVTMSLVSGNIDTQVFANLQALAPIFKKYKYLVEDVQQQ